MIGCCFKYLHKIWLLVGESLSDNEIYTSRCSVVNPRSSILLSTTLCKNNVVVGREVTTTVDWCNIFFLIISVMNE